MKTIIVTDPCYLITDRDWDAACEAYLKTDEGLPKFKKCIQDLLRVISGDDKALTDDTGYGDWCNEIDGHQFYADSGMVCVVEYTDKLKKYLDKEKIILPIGVAYVEMNDDVKYKIDTSNPNWSIVKVKDSEREVSSML